MAIEKLTITKVNYTDKKKDGTAYGNYGKPSYKTGILCNEHGATWINGFLPFKPDRWEGSEQTLEVYEDPKWGWSFKLPPREGSPIRRAGDPEQAAKIAQLTVVVNAMREAMYKAGLMTPPIAKIPGTDVQYPPMNETNNAAALSDEWSPEASY